MVRPASGGYRHSPASPEGHAAWLVAIAAAVYLAQAGQVLAAVVVVVALVIIVFLKGTPPGGDREWKEFQARGGQDLDAQGVPATCPDGGAIADNHGASRLDEQ